MIKKIALIGNPNTGKSTFFNTITGLFQKTGNYSGTTVEKNYGFLNYKNQNYKIYDLPGIYGIHTDSLDENITLDIILNKKSEDFPDLVIYVADGENLSKNLILYTQIRDLGFNTILCITMSDLFSEKNIEIDIESLEKKLECPIFLINSKNKKSINNIECFLDKENIDSFLFKKEFLNLENVDNNYFKKLRNKYPKENIHKIWFLITQKINFKKSFEKINIINNNVLTESEIKRFIQKEIIKRHLLIKEILINSYKKIISTNNIRSKIDSFLFNPFYGILFFVFILFLIFQLIFNVSSYPTDIIDLFFSKLSLFIKNNMDKGSLNDFISNGFIPGVSGFLVFVPQIFLLFLFISILEDSGYMSRVVFVMDKLMKPFGLSGKSLIPFITGFACSIPAILSVKNIDSKKERLITILTLPFITCSARLPVFIILIELMFPKNKDFYFFSIQSIILILLYLTGFFVTILFSFLINIFLQKENKNHFIIELPDYKIPSLKNIFYKSYNSIKSFILDAGKIVFSITIIIWFLGSYNLNVSNESVKFSKTENIEKSLLGNIGKGIEPAISPLGYDWKIGISIVSSFIAREVFVSTLYTIYSIDGEKKTILNELKKEKLYGTNKNTFNFATCLSLLVFYMFSMQCISTFSVVKKQLNIYWALGQLLFMSVFAYVMSYITYNLF